MDLVLWIAWGSGLGLVLMAGLLPISAKRIAARTDRLARRVGLAALPPVRARIARQLLLQRRWSAVGGGIALGALTLLVGLATGWTWSPAASWMLVGGSMAAAAIGSAVAALHPDRGLDGRRIARARAVTAADYLPTAERIAARALPALGLAVVIVAAAASPDRAAVELVGGVLVIAAVLLFEVGSRRVLATPQPAGTVDELAWDDALRATSLRDLALAPMAAGAYAGYAAGWTLDPGEGSALLLGGACAAVVVAVFALRSLGEPVARHFLRRLWPETARAAEAAA